MVNTKKLKSVIDASYENNKNASNILKKRGYTIDKKLSGKREKIFTNKKGNVNMVVRGSSNATDWLVSDRQILTGTLKDGKRVLHTNKKIDKVRKIYNQEPRLYGHSLGGSVIENSIGTGKIITYNKGASPFSSLYPNNQNLINYRSKGDIISYFTPKYQETRIINNPQLNPLYNHSSKPLKY